MISVKNPLTSSFLVASYICEAGVYANGVTKLAVLAILSLLTFTSSPFSQPIFDPPANLGPKINTFAYEADPFWDGTRKGLYFVKAGPTTINGGEDIYFADWTDTGWAAPQPVTAINTAERERSPSVSPDGQMLYFVTFVRPGAVSAWDIWVSSWDTSLNDWGVPIELPCPVNTTGVEYSSKIGPSGNIIYFYSSLGNCNFPQQSGLLYSVFDSISGWSIPQSLGPNINAGGGEEYASITADSNWLYFQRNAGTFVSPWTGSDWGPAFDLTPQMGDRGFTPSVVPSGDSLFFYSPLLPGFGNGDIFLMEQIASGIGEGKEANLPENFELHQNYPNPFNGQTRIHLFASRSLEGDVDLTIYNILGQPVRHLLRGERPSGQLVQTWDGRDDSGKEVSGGIYLYELRAVGQREVKKMIFLK